MEKISRWDWWGHRPFALPPCWLTDSDSERHMFREEHTEGEGERVLRWTEQDRWRKRGRESLIDMPCWRETERKPMLVVSLALSHSLSFCLSPGCCCPTESTVWPTPVYYYLFKPMDSTCTASTLMNWFSVWDAARLPGRRTGGVGEMLFSWVRESGNGREGEMDLCGANGNVERCLGQ